MSSSQVIILMGVSGCGKTTVGKALAEKLNIGFIDADDYHSVESVKKMLAGEPLVDKDREIWLSVLTDIIIRKMLEKSSFVLACSALKKKYRQQLKVSEDVRFIYLAGSKDVIRERMLLRKHLFMSPTLLDSQFACLEVPSEDECLTINVDLSVHDIVEIITQSHFTN
ncbi:probable gluconokinase isoform X2 [Hydra vulgaris]|uniref:Gluconokinase n=1 Tax=Hydra vulgaris TaxID=6087 RepID=A0ABM4D9U9_HYDVU